MDTRLYLRRGVLVFGLAMVPGTLFWVVFSLQIYPYFFVRQSEAVQIPGSSVDIGEMATVDSRRCGMGFGR